MLTGHETMTLRPEHFELTILVEARRLMEHALAQSSSHRLDERTTFWVLRREAWIDLMRDVRYQRSEPGTAMQSRRKELMGLPVRITVDDEPDVPMIQLVMEPQLHLRPSR